MDALNKVVTPNAFHSTDSGIDQPVRVSSIQMKFQMYRSKCAEFPVIVFFDISTEFLFIR